MCVAARQINENNYYIFESTWARAPFLGSKLFTVRMLVDAVAAPRFLTRRCIWRSRRKTAEEASESRPPARRGADDKEMPDPTNAHTALLRQKRQCEQSKHAVRMQCCVASWLRSLAGGCGGEEAGVGHVGAAVAKKKPKRGVRARSQRAHKVRTFII